MSVWTALILGLLAGWLIEWVIDWLYWRRAQPQVATATPAALAAPDDARLRADLDAASAARRDADARLMQANAALEATRAAQAKLQAELDGANELARRHKAGLDALQASVDSQKRERDDARTLTSGVLGAGTSAGMATVQIDNVEAELENERLRRELEALHGELTRVKTTYADPLIDINGIGPVYERKLFAAGVYTFEELAALAPERLRAIISPEQWQNIDAEAWIAEAREFAQRARAGRRPA